MSALWDAGLAGKALTLATGWTAADLATSVPDFNLLFNVVTFALIALVARPLLKMKVKDGTIKDLQDSNAAKDDRLRDFEEHDRARINQLRQFEQAAVHCRTEATDAKARYEELQKYTAQPAVEHFETLLADHSARVAERHSMMLDALERMTATLALIQEGMNGGSTST